MGLERFVEISTGIQMNVEELVEKAAGKITLPEDPSKEYLEKFRNLAGGTIEGPIFFLDETSRLNAFDERLSTAEYVPSEWEENCIERTSVSGDISQFFNRRSFNKAKTQKSEEVAQCITALEDAFGQVFDRDYTPGDIVLFKRIHSGIKTIDIGVYISEATNTQDRSDLKYVRVDALKQIEIKAEDILCKAEKTLHPPSDGDIAVVYHAGNIEICGYASIPKSGSNPYVLSIDAAASLPLYTREQIKDRDVYLLKACVINDIVTPKKGPYR
ncbi:hypothetical protein HQ545_00785 [Candidatus Woesearchaeota archaeon]|nr:hypothetical protein [Candidatus Woesearchaeota archaeon]